MYGFHLPIPHVWLPLFVIRPDANPSPWTSQGNPLPPFHSSVFSPIGAQSTSSSHVDEIQHISPESIGKSLSTPSIHDTVEPNDADQSGDTVEVKDADQSVSTNTMHTEGADIVEESKSHRFEDESIRYVTLGCACGGKTRNSTTNVARPHPTSKTECKARINVMLEKGVLKVSSVNNFHNHSLSPQKSRFFCCNREVSESVKRVLDINDQAGIRMNKSFTSLVQEVDGFENLPFAEKDCRNYIDKARHL
ncbi:uncharacterized protein LOC122279550 [Carya illinoinensis]|uniref:uncharacterized protein LOC122279550 n=1 Tax=Carya illinoinensis TaxID=32201 RepID=UPI001C7275E2|nr:uncharacterized protein LOC122279550 [Carya illinoinensis]